MATFRAAGQTPPDTTPPSVHRVAVGGLLPLTRYTYEVNSKDAAGNVALRCAAS